MKTYNVTYTETLRRAFAIEAENEDEAIERLREAIGYGDVILCADDYVCESGEIVCHGELKNYSAECYDTLND